eukprot:gb/GECH01009647.1/.p1 GENE.gb/GECH01009647.1/~~gb/GECH01009647.1/.p1  ORF type:complete len:325 (+),score=49.93 gb/GECH01009647.1/:1-975(+)
MASLGRYAMKVFSGTSNHALAEEVAKCLNVPLGKMNCKRFADGEVSVQVGENVRGCDVFIVQPTCPPSVNDHTMELFLIVDALRRASAKRITAVIPYYGYARQDRKTSPRVPISAALIAELMEAAGVHRVLSVDLHCGQIQGFFRIPVDNLYAAPVLFNHFRGMELVRPVVVSPDAGGTERASLFRAGLTTMGFTDVGLAIMNKNRKAANVVGEMELVGSVDGSDVIIVDDMIDTAGTLCKAADVLQHHGAKRVFACATHPLFSGPALDRLEKSAIEQVVITDTIPLQGSCSKVVQLSVGKLLSEAIRRVHNEESVSSLFSVFS